MFALWFSCVFRNAPLRQADKSQSWSSLLSLFKQAHVGSLRIDSSVLIPFRVALQDCAASLLSSLSHPTATITIEQQQKQQPEKKTRKAKKEHPAENEPSSSSSSSSSDLFQPLTLLSDFLSLLLGKFSLSFSPPFADFINLIAPLVSSLGGAFSSLPLSSLSASSSSTSSTSALSLFLRIVSHLLNYFDELMKRQANSRTVFESMVCWFLSFASSSSLPLIRPALSRP
jgi:hypothetical protein